MIQIQIIQMMTLLTPMVMDLMILLKFDENGYETDPNDDDTDGDGIVTTRKLSCIRLIQLTGH